MFDFPASPSVGQTFTPPGGPTYTWDGAKWTSPGSPAFPIYVGDSPPATAADNSLWFNTSDGSLYFYYNDGNSKQWVAVAAATTPPPAAVIRGHITGLTLSTAGSSTTFSIAAGYACDSAGVGMMSLISSLNKTTAAWAVGFGSGGLDTGAIAANTWYHVHLIKRMDTSVVDALISLSATTPTLPAGYSLSRRIGSLRTNASSQWVLFFQVGDRFQWTTPFSDAIALAVGTTSQLVTLTVPTNIRTTALFVGSMVSNTVGTLLLMHEADQTTQVANTPAGNYQSFIQVANMASPGQFQFLTNLSAQIRTVSNATTATCSLYIYTQGWIDRRGRDD